MYHGQKKKALRYAAATKPRNNRARQEPSLEQQIAKQMELDALMELWSEVGSGMSQAIMSQLDALFERLDSSDAELEQNV